ncbi:MAG: preprotein translocase subunit SecG [Gammaproteobacteria bacterium HGW-Gammaproteobacteria-3]|nr:MAG: preprotein translocase subunit SecG [Gammaproteobacteria bacterium HGW-Gammaproteobacteria-3]
MYQVIIVFHVLFGLCVIGLVLMQQGKGADAGAAFGSGASGTVFGAQGAASFLSRTTAILAALFFMTSLGLAFLSGSNTEIKDFFDQPDAAVSDMPLLSDESAPIAVPSINDVPTIVDSAPAPEATKPESSSDADKPQAFTTPAQ